MRLHPSLLLLPLLLFLSLPVRADDDDDDDKYRQEGFEVLDITDKFDKNYQPPPRPKVEVIAAAAGQKGSLKTKRRKEDADTSITTQRTKGNRKKKGILNLIEQANKLEDPITKAAQLQQSPEGSGAIAFLFLARQGLPLQALWQSYLKGCPTGSYQVLIHQQAGGVNTELAEPLPADEVVPGDLRYKYDMNRAMWHLLDRANGNPAVTWFHFLSDGCIPVRSCASLHSFLSNGKGRSFVGNLQETDPSGQNNIDAWLRRSRRCFNGQDTKMPCIKSSQWMTLYKPHATLLLSQIIPAEEGWWSQSFVPDEHMIPTVFSEKGLPVTGHVLTWVKWPKANWPEPAAWADGPPQEDCAVDQGHPCPINLGDPHVLNPSARQFFVRKIALTDLATLPNVVTALTKRYSGEDAEPHPESK